ncbi:GNAT family N-acetyltransferase [Pseudomonas sp. PA15(2017)]|uniref:GNAT family N-acetyltransferase n=1 Tax=Pseudomonas sp. PA15(2017) TaxID=1932111 RepID=UPI0009634924|nr:GNAT family N-acetyltransferase [Pseudomonas sp. PA15(2017)]OLU23635.1 GNAT family N-acetyltransferase [Pseudomonas sp. PA15(2017)]
MIGKPAWDDSKPVLRPARVTDLPAIYRGELGYIRQWEPQHEQAWQMAAERHLAQWVENFERLTIVCVDDQLVGYSLWADELGHAELYTLHVSEAYRRRGIGQMLVGAYIDSARQVGFETLSLHVRADNPARRLYERAGFAHLGANALGYLHYELQVAD